VFEKLYSIESATFLLAVVTAILCGVTVYNTRIFQKDQQTSRDLIWIEKKLENFYNPLIYLLYKRRQLINKYEKTEKIHEKEDIINKLFENSDKIEAIKSKYHYLGSSWETYNTDADISDFEGSGLVDKNEIDRFRNILNNEFNKLSEEHATLMGKIKIEGVHNTSELEKIFKEEKSLNE
jgi:hypothetical protein